MDMRRARRLVHLRVARLRPAVANVVKDRVVEEHRVLGDDADRRAQARLLHLAQVGAIDEDRARSDVVKAIQEARDGRLAGARMAHHRDAMAGGDGEAHVEEDLPRPLVTKVDVAEFHRRRPRRQLGRARLVLDFTVLVQQPEHAVHVEERLLDLAIDHAEEVERDVELDQQPVYQHEIA